MIIYRSSAGWTVLGAGTSGQVLTTQGTTADPHWTTPSTGGGLAPIANGQILANIAGGSAVPIGNTLSDILDTDISTTRGAFIFRGATAWGQIPPGTAGDFLRTSGTGADPAWVPISVSDIDGITLTGGTSGDILMYGGAAWTNVRPKYAIACYVPGVPTASQNLLFHRFSKDTTIPANAGAYLGHTSEAAGSAAATASTVLTLAKAASATPTTFSSVGTITFAAGAVVGTWATTGGAAVTFAQGDILRLQAPATPDATLADVHMTLVGYET